MSPDTPPPDTPPPPPPYTPPPGSGWSSLHGCLRAVIIVAIGIVVLAGLVLGACFLSFRR